MEILDVFYGFWMQNKIYILNTLKAIFAFSFGVWLAYFLRTRVRKLVSKKDEILGNFLAQAIFIITLVLSLLTLLGTLGVQTASIIAVLGTAGLAIALALKDSLSSLASGIVLIVLRPFKKNDLVEIGSIVGKVEAINLFQTTLRLPDNKLAIIPNEAISRGTIINCTDAEKRRIEWVVGVAYSSDIEQVREILMQVIAEIKEIATDPQPFVGATELSSSSINFSIRVWIENSANLFAIRSLLIENSKKALDEAQIEIPYNKLDISVVQR